MIALFRDKSGILISGHLLARPCVYLSNQIQHLLNLDLAGFVLVSE